MQNRVVISGISGLLGSHLALWFEAEGYQVIGLKQAHTPVPQQLNGYQIHQGDIIDEDFLGDVIQAGDVVIHCAALVSFDQKDQDSLFRINVEGTRAILNVSQQQGVSKFVLVSSVAALGRSSVGNMITENAQWENSKYNTNYAYSKYLAELEFWRAHEEGLNGFVVNPSVILGKGDLYGSSNKLFLNLFKKYVFAVEGSINLVGVEDVVRSIWLLHTKGIDGERYILNGAKKSIQSVMQLMVDASPKNNRVVKVSLRLAFVVRAFENFYCFITQRKAQLTKETLTVLKAESNYDKGKIINELSLTFEDIDQTIKDCARFYVDKYGGQLL